MKKCLFPLVFLYALSFQINAQGTIDDYKRAWSLRETYNNKVFNSGVQPEWIDNTSSFWYVRNAKDGKTYFRINAIDQNRTNLFDHTKLAGKLSEAIGKAMQPNALSLEQLHVSDHFDTLTFVFEKGYWEYSIFTNRLKQKGACKPEAEEYWGGSEEDKTGKPTPSPDGKKEAFIRENNVWVKDLSNDKTMQISLDGAPGEYYSVHIYWSPDGTKLACVRVRPAEKRIIQFIESSPTDQLQPKLHKREYNKPGDALPYREPRIFDLSTGNAIIPSTTLYENQCDLWNLQWNTDSKAVTFEYNQRGHQVYRILELSATKPEIRTLVEETSPTYINYNLRFRHDLKNGTELLWTSERDNWNHLYLYDRKSGKVKKQITKGEWYVREIQHVDEDKRLIWFSANGMNKNEDPYLIHYYRINMDGSNLVSLTPEDGMHKAWFSDQKKYLVDVWSKTDAAPTAVLRDAQNGQILMTLEKADISALQETGWKAPETFVAKGRDGKTDMWGLIYRPSHFDSTKVYPIIEYIYSGPGSQYVPKTFSTWNWNMSSLAELGFIVVQLDAMTTSFRSKSFESICYKNLKDAGLPDRIAWIKAAAQKYPYMDTTRVGIFGASAGGQEAMTATLFYPEFYKAAYSACGCHDNRMDKIWWNEQWMGYPVDESYKASSNVENAHLLKTALMLVVGEMDDNVDPASTMQVANALIKANKDFELVVLPGIGHTMGGTFGEHKRFDFFVRNLLHQEPPKWSAFP
jgi:dipeptidyl aminopeptidase/acylaminoacyl peptidase